MHTLEKIREMLMEELEECSKKSELTSSSLDMIDKLTHSIKSIDTVMAMEDAGYSNDGYSYARRGNVRRDSMGRYSRTYDGSYNDGMSYARDDRGYSRGSAKHELAMELKELKMGMRDPETTRMIDKWIRQVEE